MCVIDGLRNPQFDEFVIDGADDTRIQPGTDSDIWKNFIGCGIGAYENGMIAVDGNDLVDIGAQADHRIATRRGVKQLNGKKRHVFDFDMADFRWRNEPEHPFGVAGQGGREQADEPFATNRRVVIIPDSITVDP